MNVRKRYNYEFLKELCKEYNITLLRDYSNENLHRDYKIEGNCKTENCNENFEKTLGGLSKKKYFCCKKCTKQIENNNKATNNIQKYGVKSPLQLESVKQKIKETNLEKYGHEYATQSQEVRDKTIKTCLEKFGAETNLQLESVKQQIKETNLEKYGHEYATQSQEIRDKTIKTCLEKFGTECSLQSQEVKNKGIETNLEKYGCEYATQSKIVRDKVTKTCLKKYGVKSPLQLESVKQQIKQTNLEKYGHEYSLQSQEVKDKGKQTNLKKYGVEYPNQNMEIMEKNSKNSYKLKDYILPSGEIIKIQGYENYALDELFNNDILEENIITGCKNVPEIWYDDENGKKHRHYVDIFISSQNRCIEIKSTWTAEKKKDCIFLKQKAGKELGYNYEIWVYNGKGEKVECYK